MTAKQTSKNTRDAILSAAAGIVVREGAARLTLDAAAREAGVSKGGLLYHFPNKDALIEGMVERMNQEFADRIRQAYESDDFGTNKGRWLRALIRATLTSTHLELGGGLIAAVLLNPDLLEPNRRSYRLRQSLIEQDGVEPILASIIRFALDGLWFSELLSFAPPDEARRAELMETLLSFTLGNDDWTTGSDQ